MWRTRTLHVLCIRTLACSTPVFGCCWFAYRSFFPAKKLHNNNYPRCLLCCRSCGCWYISRRLRMGRPPTLPTLLGTPSRTVPSRRCSRWTPVFGIDVIHMGDACCSSKMEEHLLLYRAFFLKPVEEFHAPPKSWPRENSVATPRLTVGICLSKNS